MKTRCKFILFSASCLAILGIAQFGGMQYLSTYIVSPPDVARILSQSRQMTKFTVFCPKLFNICPI